MSSIENVLVSFFNCIGSLVCHQVPERTLWIGGQYLPVCARDTGAYLGFYLGYSLLTMRRKEAHGPPNLWITLFGSLPLIIDGISQYVGMRTSTNMLRLITGLLFGTFLAPFLVYSLSIMSSARSIPFLKGLLPEEVRFEDKESWLGFWPFSLGLLFVIISFVLINYVIGSTSQVLYWILSSLIIFSVGLHIFFLPLLLIFLILLEIRKRQKLIAPC